MQWNERKSSEDRDWEHIRRDMTNKQYGEIMQKFFVGLKHNYSQEQQKILLRELYKKLSKIEAKHLNAAYEYFVFEKSEEWFPAVGSIVRFCKKMEAREGSVRVSNKVTRVNFEANKEARRKFMDMLKRSRND